MRREQAEQSDGKVVLFESKRGAFVACVQAGGIDAEMLRSHLERLPGKKGYAYAT